MARVIARGPAPPSRGDLIGEALGKGFGTGMQQQLNLQQQAQQLNPLREALLGQLDAQGQLSPTQEFLRTAAQDPTSFATALQSPELLTAASTLLESGQAEEFSLSPGEKRFRGSEVIASVPETSEKQTRQVVVSGNERLGIGMGVPPDEHAIVEEIVTPDGVVQSRSVKSRFATREDAESNLFGSGLRGRSLEFMTTMAPRFATGELSEDEENIFMSAVTEYTQPRTTIDPITQQPIETRPELPPQVQRAFEQRDMRPPQERGRTEIGIKEDWQDPRLRFGPINQEAQDQPLGGTRAPEDAQLPAPKVFGEALSDSETRTIAEEALANNISGPIPLLRTIIPRIPGLGARDQEATSIKAGLPILRNRLVKGLQTNPRYAVTERQSIIEDLSIDPKVLDTPQAYFDRLVGIDQTLDQLQTEMERVVQGDEALVTGETMGMAMDTLQTLQFVRKALIPPRINSEEQYEEFKARNEVGTPYIAPDPETGNVELFYVD